MDVCRSPLCAQNVVEPRAKSLNMKAIENQWKPLDINENNDQSMKIVPWPGDACATGGVRQHRETIRNLKGGVKEGVGAQIGSQGGRGLLPFMQLAIQLSYSNCRFLAFWLHGFRRPWLFPHARQPGVSADNVDVVGVVRLFSHAGGSRRIS